MYNRYIPNNDGSYHRHPIPDTQPVTQVPPSPQPTPPASTTPPPPAKPTVSGSPAGFLKNLLPKNFDIGDLIVVLLLLLMAGDCEEDQNTALLTLALYFFL